MIGLGPPHSNYMALDGKAWSRTPSLVILTHWTALRSKSGSQSGASDPGHRYRLGSSVSHLARSNCAIALFCAELSWGGGALEQAYTPANAAAIATAHNPGGNLRPPLASIHLICSQPKRSFKHRNVDP